MSKLAFAIVVSSISSFSAGFVVGHLYPSSGSKPVAGVSEHESIASSVIDGAGDVCSNTVNGVKIPCGETGVMHLDNGGVVIVFGEGNKVTTD